MAACGRRWGKSLAGVTELAKYSWENPEDPSWWVSPTYRQARKPFNLVLDKFAGAIDSHKASEERSVVWKSGGRSEFVSAEKYENLRVRGAGLMVVDEAAFVARVAWEQVLRPMLTDTMGRLLALGTPKGKGGSWFWELWCRGNDPAEADYASFHFPTSSSPYIADEEVAEAQRTLPEDVFAQEYLAAFLDDAAGVFRNVRACIAGELTGPTPGSRYVMGVDLARKRDFTVCVVIDVATMHVVAFERFNQISWKVQGERVASLARRYGAPVLMDSTGVGAPIVEMVRDRGVRVDEMMFNNRTKQQLIENLAVAIEHRSVTFPDIPVLIDELDAYQYEITKTHLVRYAAPDGYHDDAVIALALAVWEADHGAMGPVLVVWDEVEVISPF